MTSKEIIEKFWQSVNDRNWDLFLSLVDNEVVYSLPQTREKVKGKLELKEFNENYSGQWTLETIRVVAEENQGSSQILFKDNNEIQTGITFFEIRNGKIFKIEEFWPEPYDPPKRNSSSVIRY